MIKIYNAAGCLVWEGKFKDYDELLLQGIVRSDDRVVVL